MVKSITDPWISLAAAIINSGVKCYDTIFLKSNWCAFLKSYVGEAMNKDNSNIATIYLNNTVITLH